MMLSISMEAQRVTGKVTTAPDGLPLPGVSVLLKGTSIGGVTDSNGVYSLAVSDAANSALLFSFVGFVTQEIPLHGRSIVDVALVEDARQLDEVVVTALGIPREMKTLVYSTHNVKTEELTDVRDANNVLNSLSGKIANALITQSSGGVGSGARIVLRGNRSIQNTNNALIVVDGVPINNVTTAFGDREIPATDGASNLNPDDIESMTVLPGASAAALYGSAAGNGVIVVTTKKGKAGKVSVTVNSGVTSESVFVLPAVQNEYGQGFNGVANGYAPESWGARTNGQWFTGYMGDNRKYYAEPDNIKDFFRKGLSVNNSFGITAGSDKIQTYLSYTNNKVQGIIPQNDLTRHTINLRLSQQINSKFSTDAKITYILQDTKHKPSTATTNNLIKDIFLIPRNVSLDDAKNFETIDNTGTPVPTFWPYQNSDSKYIVNPYWQVHRTSNNENRSRIMGFVLAKYNLTNWLDITGRANLDKIADSQESFESHGQIYLPYAGGNYSKATINISQLWLDLILSGSSRINKSLRVEYRAGGILQDNNYDALYNNAKGLNVPNKFSLNFATNPVSYQDASHIQTQSLFAQVNLAFKESIFLDASVRNDWVSTLPPPYTVTYPSVGLSAIVSDLATLPRAISFLKLSANYAEVGNGAPFGIKNNTYEYFPGAGHGFIVRNTIYALEELKPELVKNLEFGVDARFMENKFGFTFFLYKSNSTNQILSLPLAAPSGYSHQLINAGNIQNKGLELVVNVIPVKTKKLTWDIAFNLGMNRNKIVELHKDIKTALLGFELIAIPIVKEGKSFGDLAARCWKKNALGQYVVTDDGMPVATEVLELDSLESVGNFYPKSTLGLTNTIHYNRFSLRVLMDGRIGGVIVSGTEAKQAYWGNAEVTAGFRESGLRLGGVNEEGMKVDAIIETQEFWRSLQWVGEFFAYDATNFRVRELALSYQVPVPPTFLIKQIRISAIARNLFFLYRGSSLLAIPGIGKRKMSFDPDMALYNNNAQGREEFTMPSTRTIGFNVQMTF